MNHQASLTVLGARGSVPVSGKAYTRYGGATTCYRLRLPDCTVFLDAGTGILRHSGDFGSGRCHILLSHPHVDHLYGLPMLKALYSPVFNASIWGADFMGKSVQQQLDSLMRPPLWPITSEVFRANIGYNTFSPGSTLCLTPAVTAETLAVSHPGGCVAYKINAWDKVLVFATDTELAGETAARLADFASGCDLLIIDAQYTNDEYAAHAGFGHSSAGQALALISRCGAKAALLTHHDPFRTDDELDVLAAVLPSGVRLAHEGMEVSL